MGDAAKAERQRTSLSRGIGAAGHELGSLSPSLVTRVGGGATSTAQRFQQLLKQLGVGEACCFVVDALHVVPSSICDAQSNRVVQQSSSARAQANTFIAKDLFVNDPVASLQRQRSMDRTHATALELTW
jgi:hypothetical protein